MPEWRRLPGPLGAEELGPAEATRVTFVHGFTQTRNSWKPIAEGLADRGYLATVVDLPGHGESSDVRADLWATAAMLAEVGGHGHFVGYSLGGRACLHVGLSYPVRSLVLIGAHPGIEDEAERDARHVSDDALAVRLRTIGVDAFLREWTALPLFGALQLSEEQLADRERNTADGLASSLESAGTGVQTVLWPRLGELSMPVLALSGALDRKFSEIAGRIAASVPHGVFATVPRASHAAHLEQPDEVAALVADHLARTDSN